MIISNSGRNPAHPQLFDHVRRIVNVADFMI